MPSRHCAAGFGNISQPRYALLTNDEQNVMKNRMWKEVSRVMLAVLLAVILVAPASAQTREQAKRIYDRLAGVPPTEAVLTAMENNPGTDPVCQQNNVSGPKCAAYMAMENASFYNVTLKNFAAPWTNRDRSVFVPLNDYIATVIGMIRDDVDFRTVLSADMQYVGSGVSPAPAANNNSHYEALEAGDYNLKTVLQPALQSNINRLPPDATAGVITSRAAAEAFFIAGTNRAMFRFTMVNHFCKDMEQLHDPRLSPDRIRQDVSRSPGGDSRLFLNNCVGCHTGMDPMAQAFAYYDYNETDGAIEFTDGIVQDKYYNNDLNFPQGFRTPDDHWTNYWRTGQNRYLDFYGPPDPTDTNGDEYADGYGAKSLGVELSNSTAFASCQVKKVFQSVCLREPESANDHSKVDAIVESFGQGPIIMKQVFAESAEYCMGQ
jgi:hypothetical protein